MGLFCALLITFSFSFTLCGNPAGGDPRGGMVYNFTANAEVGGGTITFELEKDNSGARAAANPYGLSGKLKDDSNIVPLSGTFLPGLGVFTASTTSNGKTFSITGTINAEGKLIDSMAAVYNHDTNKAASFLVGDGSSAIVGAAVADPGDFSIPGELYGTWRSTSDHLDRNAEKFGITIKMPSVNLISPAAFIGGQTCYVEWDGGSLEFMSSRQEIQIISFDEADGFPGVYDIITSHQNYGAQSPVEREESFAAYLDGLVEKGTISTTDKDFYLKHVEYKPNPEELEDIFDTSWVDSKEKYIRCMEVVGGFFVGGFERNYFFKKGQSPKVLYERTAFWRKSAGEIAAGLNFRWDDKKVQYTEDLDWLKSQPLVDGIDGEFGDPDGNIMDELEQCETMIPWNG